MDRRKGDKFDIQSDGVPVGTIGGLRRGKRA
jgi:hypothetical protein